MSDDSTPSRPSTARAFHDGLSSLSHDSSAPPPASLSAAVAADPAGIHIELHKEGQRNDRRLAHIVDEVFNAIQEWMDHTMQTLMLPDIYNGTDEARREWLGREGFHFIFEPATLPPPNVIGTDGLPVVPSLGVYVLKHRDRVVSTFELKGARASKLEVPR